MDIPEIVYEHRLKVPVCRNENFLVRYEEHIEGTFIHCDVYNWSKTVRDEMAGVWNILSRLHGGPIYALHDIHDRKHEKFLNLFGFVKKETLRDGEELWIWSNNG